MKLSGRLGVALCVSVVVALAGCARRTTFDHVVFVTIDTLRADHLGCYGYPLPTSPFIDSLAAAGVRFERAIASSSHTAPSHASMFTSQYPARHGVLFNGLELDQGIPTLASLFGEAGFDTAAVMSLRFLNGVTSGFHDVRGPGRRKIAPWRARRTLDAAIAWLESRDRDRRFFLWVHLFDPHEWWHKRARPDEVQLERMSEAAKRDQDRMLRFWQTEQGITAEDLRPDKIVVYDAQIALVDEQLQRLYDVVREREAGARILWVITSDHGEGLGSHGLAGHGKHLYQEQVRVPLILHGGPGWQGGRVVPEMVRHVDLLPTLAELAGVTIDTEALGVEGVSFVPLLLGDEHERAPRFAYSQRRPADERRLRQGWSDELVIAAQTTRYKYILRTEGKEEFYDLESDPLEMNDLAAEDLPEKERMARWLAGKYESMLKSPLADSGEVEIDEKYLEELRALGYLQ